MVRPIVFRGWLAIALVGLLTCGHLPRAWAADTSNPPPREVVSTLAELGREAVGVPFSQVIRATTGHRIVPFDPQNAAHRALVQRLQQAAAAAGERARKGGIVSARANEAGNYMEAFVKAALQEAGFTARTPVASAGGAQTTGYPDLEILGETPCYLELKTFSAATARTTQRTFYYSPSERPKVTRDALHLLLAFQLERAERDGKTIFIPTHWKLITLQDLRVDLKLEFNQSNRGLYGREQSVLGESSLKSPSPRATK